jgi:hypothetical protein
MSHAESPDATEIRASRHIRAGPPAAAWMGIVDAQGAVAHDDHHGIVPRAGIGWVQSVLPRTAVLRAAQNALT